MFNLTQLFFLFKSYIYFGLEVEHHPAKTHRIKIQCHYLTIIFEGPGVAQWARHCATSRVVPGSNPGGVGHRDYSRGYRQNHVPWGQLSL